MAIKKTINEWKDIVELYDEYKGTKISFCALHNISIHQLYYYRKKFGAKDEIEFYPINLGKNIKANKISDNKPTIKVAIGKAIIHVEDNFDERNFSNVVKVLNELC